MKRLRYGLCLLAASAAFTSCSSKEIHIDKDITAVVVIGLISLLFLVLAMYSNLLRDEITDMAEFKANAKQLGATKKWKLVNSHAPFSLTKVQFGLWTVIISSVYIYLSLFMGDCNAAPINKTALVLMGVFAGTAVASTIMDKAEMAENRPRHQNAPSQGFFIDILSDDNGISLHRFQNFAWTIIAMTVYLYKVSEITRGCELPELSDTLLALTGISSATYLVLKSKENDPPVQKVQQANSLNINTGTNPNTTNVTATVSGNGAPQPAATAG